MKNKEEAIKSISLIKETIERSKKTFMKSYSVFLLWGVLYTISFVLAEILWILPCAVKLVRVLSVTNIVLQIIGFFITLTIYKKHDFGVLCTKITKLWLSLIGFIVLTQLYYTITSIMKLYIMPSSVSNYLILLTIGAYLTYLFTDKRILLHLAFANLFMVILIMVINIIYQKDILVNIIDRLIFLPRLSLPATFLFIGFYFRHLEKQS